MKIRLTRDVPVAREHGMTKGRVLLVHGASYEGRGRNGYHVTGDTGHPVLVKFDECEEVR